MTLKNKLETLTTEFTALKDKILAKLALKDKTLQAEQEKSQESIRKLESVLKENSTNEQTLTKLLTEFQELSKALES